MSKRQKKKNTALKVLTVILGIGAVSGCLVLIDNETNFFSKLVQEEQMTSGNYEMELADQLSAKTTDKEDMATEVKLEGENIPFETLEAKYTCYGTEEEPSVVDIGTDLVSCSYVSKVVLTFELGDEDYYINSLKLSGFEYLDPEVEEALKVSVRVGNKTFDDIGYGENLLFVNGMAVSGDVVITVTNVLGDEEANTFTLGTVEFNVADDTVYSVVEE